MLGRPRLHLRTIDSTNAKARELAAGDAPHGTLVTAREQTAGRGRQGRSWVGPPGTALLMSLVLREHDTLLPLRAGLAVADVAGGHALVKWPNDVLVEDRKVAGILVEGRPNEGWAVLGIGVNVAVELADLPAELHDTAGTLGRSPDDIEPFLSELLAALEARLREAPDATVTALRTRDALRDRTIRWGDETGTAAGIDPDGRLLVTTGDALLALDSGEVHLG
ncbi:MAG: BirA family transcriptional regulator [Solirubrobacteraceae bacterium]|nr:BirA family transcriptional regulator [Solirubrobacteraceae bacterium]